MYAKLLFIIFLQVDFSTNEPLVHLPNGWIRGRQDVTVKNVTFYAFEKIPFAAPPVGDLRFKPPQPPQNWSNILNTTHLDKICFQLSRKGPESEDCLYLNVFTPQISGDGLPVMFYVHGGGFYDGTARNLGPDLFIDNGVIYVAANYRLGPFGFLSTGDDVVSGNNGLKDSLFALEWVHNNIKLFGGDPEKVTIFGHSSGAASVAYLQLNPKAEGWFSGVICQSGTHLGPWALQREPRKTAFAFAGLLNETFQINNHSTEDLLKYLLSLPPEYIDRVSNTFYFDYLFDDVAEHTSNMQGKFFGPVIEPKGEEAFLTEKMYELIRDGKYIKVPLMIGFTSEECIEYYKDANGTKRAMEDYDTHLGWLVPADMEITDEANLTRMGRLIRDIYTNGESFSKHLGDGIRFCSDNLLKRPIMKHAEFNSKYAKTYLYVFSYDGKVGNINVELDGADSVGHGEEIKYLLCSGSNCDLSNYTKSDQITQERLIKLWTNFAKYGNPTPEPSKLLQNINWPQISTNNGNFLHVDIGENMEIRNHPLKTYSKWNELYDSLGYDDFVTY